MAVEQYPWSDSGKQLLSIFEAKIQYYGGAPVLIDELCKEDIIEFKAYKKPKKKTKFKFIKDSHKATIIDLWNKKSTNMIAQSLKISHDTVTMVARSMKLGRNKFSEKFSNGQQNKTKNMVLNLETGIYYENIMLAAKTINVTWHNLNWRISKSKVNNTSFIRV